MTGLNRARRVGDFWGWLPAFRAVAETQHLPSASKALHVTPPALSRTIRLLEAELGTKLFERKGRSISLNATGETLLQSVRHAMRTVHEALLAIHDAQLAGPIHISVPTAFAPLILPSLETLTLEQPMLVPALRAMASDQVNAALKQGAIDIAVLDDPVSDEALHFEQLLELRHDVFVTPSHPLLDTPEQLQNWPFAAPTIGPNGQRPDAWPAHRKRRIGIEVTHMQTAIDAVTRGHYVAVLPIPIATRYGLVPLGIEGIASTTLCLASRPPLALPTRTEMVMEKLRKGLHLSESRAALPEEALRE